MGPGARRPRWRRGAGHAIAVIGMFTGIFVMMASLPVGLLVFAVSGVIGWWLSAES